MGKHRTHRLLDQLIPAIHVTIDLHLEPYHLKIINEKLAKILNEFFNGGHNMIIEKGLKEWDKHLSYALAFAWSQGKPLLVIDPLGTAT